MMAMAAVSCRSAETQSARPTPTHREARTGDVQVARPPAREPASSVEPATPPSPVEVPAPLPVRLGDLPLADTDRENDFVVAPPESEPDCLAALERLGAVVEPAHLPLTQKLDGIYTCGAPEAYVFRQGPRGLRYSSRPIVTCKMALGLAHFEMAVVELSEQILSDPVTRVTHGGTYNCRKMSRFPKMVSEHSYANAIDVHGFTLKSGRTLGVKKHFGKLSATDVTKESSFLRTLANQLYDEAVFSVVLTPFFDSHHHDHFHLDQARYRVDGTRPSEPLPAVLSTP
jgi:hypothetical protein